MLRIAAMFLGSLLIGVLTTWGGFALWYQSPGNALVKVIGIVLWSGVGIIAVVALWQERAVLGVAGFAVLFAVLLIWWQHIPAASTRDWADDVAQMTTASIDGDQVTVFKVRNFDWRTTQDYTQRWETRTYDLKQLRSVDIIMSYWSGKAIAHMLVSFGFADGAQLAFSVEIRRERTESFSEIGGFFKEFELSIIAADERDVVRLRTNVRGEDDYLYRLKMRAPARRSLFLGYLEEANKLAEKPRFYNTITVNCTTLVYHMMKRIVGHLPLSYRVLLSGYIPEYVYSVGGFDKRYTLEELRQGGRIKDRALASDRSPTFSADIRRGVPGVKNTGE